MSFIFVDIQGKTQTLAYIIVLHFIISFVVQNNNINLSFFYTNSSYIEL